jgi:hypothetical protein
MDTGKFSHGAYHREDFYWQNRFENGLPVVEKAAVDN